MTKYKLGPKAAFFYDPTNQKKLLPGKVVEFSTKDLQSFRTKSAISSGHIVKADTVEKAKEGELVDGKELLEKFKQLSSELKNNDKLIKAFKREELVSMAEELGFEVETSDNKSTLFDIIVEELEESESE